MVLNEKSSPEFQLILELLKVPFLVLYFYAMLSVILLSMLMILLSILSAIRHLISGNNLNWFLNLNLIYETMGRDRKWFIDFKAGKPQLVSFDQPNTTGTVDVKMDGSRGKIIFQDAGIDFLF